MKEVLIRISYVAGAISFLLGIGGIAYLRPLTAIRKISENGANLWNFNFKTTLLFAGILGALSLSFVDSCDNYHAHEGQEFLSGSNQISSACLSYVCMLLAWFVILLTLRMLKLWRTGMPSVYKFLSVVAALLCVLGFYSIIIVFNQL
jgi:hypothetical protein